MERDNDSPSTRDTREACEDLAMLNRYKIQSMIGVGNYARVYKAVYLQSNKDLAIKAINLARTTDNYRFKFLPRELTILRRINHANICKTYEIIQVVDRIYIVMQFCSRGTLADLLQRNAGPFHEPVVRSLFAPTLAAVVYLHTNDIAHRDIKIENILLDHNYVPKLTDFSYSCLMVPSNASLKDTNSMNANAGATTNTTTNTSANTTNTSANTNNNSNSLQRSTGRNSLRLTSTFCGTLPYLSPEMIRRKAYDPKKTDAWSLGVCLFVLLNDRLPFPFSDIKAMVRRQLTRDCDFRPSVTLSENCRDLLSQLLEPEPQRRLGSQEASRHPWLSGPRERLLGLNHRTLKQ